MKEKRAAHATETIRKNENMFVRKGKENDQGNKKWVGIEHW